RQHQSGHAVTALVTFEPFELAEARLQDLRAGHESFPLLDRPMAADVVTELLGNADGAVTLANVAPGLLQLRQRVRVQSLDTQQVDRRLYQAVLPLPDGEVFPVVLQPAVVFQGFPGRRLAFT